jgi:2-polyprenyl-3-methyl-5-hydroxy-6-metoxy-1,4-benzoquinol methylase
MILKATKRLFALGGSNEEVKDGLGDPPQPAASAGQADDRGAADAELYERKVQQQINQYATEPIHDLPDIFHVWSQNFIGPGLDDVFGVGNVNEFYVEAVRESSADFSAPCRILSVGCGDGEVEVLLANSLQDRGADFRLEGVDLSPLLIERFDQSVREQGLEARVFPRVADLNDTRESEQYDVIMANHSLHHMVDLEKLFDFIKASLKDGGIFATADMIGRNGHMRWPETEAVLQAIWPLLSEKQRFNHQLLQLHAERFEDFDCSLEGFEGIRAQDILYLILNRFCPYKFFGYGGFIDLLVDRGFGHGFDAESEQDRALITTVAKINDIMLDAGMIKPTVMMGYFTKNDRPRKYFRTRSASASVRMPYDTPQWPEFYKQQ